MSMDGRTGICSCNTCTSTIHGGRMSQGAEDGGVTHVHGCMQQGTLVDVVAINLFEEVKQMALIKIVLFTMLLVVVVMFFTLYRNEANLFQPPGIEKRLSVFLTTNIAVTSDDHQFEELRTPVFNLSAEKLYLRVLDVAAVSGWNIIAHDSDNKNANFVVLSPILLFEDDVYVQVNSLGEDQSSLYIHSKSHTGYADLSSNSSHIQDLVQKIRND